MNDPIHVGPGKVVEVKYTLREQTADGAIIEVMDEQWPLCFLFGAGAMLPVFEENLGPLHSGARFEFRIAAADAYGAHDPNQVVQLFLDDINVDPRYPFENHEVGDFVQLNTADGRSVAGVMQQCNKRFIVVDCNHVMAGKDLWFEGQILFIREARADELLAQRYIEPSGVR